MLWKSLLQQKDSYNKVLFWCLLITLLSLAFSIRFLNSIAIFALALATILHPERKTFIKKAFRNPYFIACIALFLSKLIGVFYTEHFNETLRQVQTKIAWIAIPFFFCSNNTISSLTMRRLMMNFTVALLAVSLYSLVHAFFIYMQLHDSSVFFYHELVRPVRHHAVVFSFYLLFCLIYWMEEGLAITKDNRQKKFLQGVVCFFFLFIVLLASKLAIIISFLYGAFFATKRFFRRRRSLLLFSLITFSLLLLLAVVKNPVKDRFLDLANGGISLFKQEKFSPGVYFNGLQFRLLIWRFTYEILNEKKAWLIGVSTGDAQIELNKKYVEANLYQGDGVDDKKGYLVYNSHNVFLQTLLESGLVGLFFLLCIIVIFIKQTIKRERKPPLIFFLAMLAFCFTESVLSSQYTILLFMFFPLLSLNASNEKER